MDKTPEILRLEHVVDVARANSIDAEEQLKKAKETLSVAILAHLGITGAIITYRRNDRAFRFRVTKAYTFSWGVMLTGFGVKSDGSSTGLLRSCSLKEALLAQD